YVDFPTHSVMTLRGMRKYSTDLARANEFGGTMHTSPSNGTNDLSSKLFGSTMALFTFVKILYSFATRMSYPYEDNPYDIVPLRTWASSNGSIMPRSRAIFRIQWSGLMLM